MTRVERRMYRQRQQRVRLIRAVLFGGCLLAMAATLILLKKPHMLAEGIQGPTPTPAASAWDRTVVTREVTLPAETWYTIQTGVFSSESAAIEKAAAYADRGAPGTVVKDGGKWRVFIASYDREEDAAAVRQRLGEAQRVETYLYAWQCPALRLRLTGMGGQLDVAEAGLTLFTQAASRLRDTATLLDAGQLTTEEAQAAVRELDSAIKLWADTACSRFGRQPPALVEGLLTLTDGWTTRRKSLEAAAGSPTDLSAQLKGQGMEMYAEMIGLRASFA